MSCRLPIFCLPPPGSQFPSGKFFAAQVARVTPQSFFLPAPPFWALMDAPVPFEEEVASSRRKHSPTDLEFYYSISPGRRMKALLSSHSAWPSPTGGENLPSSSSTAFALSAPPPSLVRLLSPAARRRPLSKRRESNEGLDENTNCGAHSSSIWRHFVPVTPPLAEVANFVSQMTFQTFFS